VKVLIAGAALAIAAVVALTNGGDEVAYSQNSEFRQGVERVDTALDGVLNENTHDELAAQADSSATWVRGLGDSVQRMTD